MSNIEFKQEPKQEWIEKIWGRTRCVCRGPNFEVHELEVKAGGYCSRHRHRKRNRFHVMSGKLVVEMFAKYEHLGTPREEIALDRIITPGHFFHVGALQWHRFRALEDTHLLEIYWIDIDPDDIERADEGGMFFDGKIGDVKVFEKSLSDEEVGQLALLDESKRFNPSTSSNDE